MADNLIKFKGDTSDLERKFSSLLNTIKTSARDKIKLNIDTQTLKEISNQLKNQNKEIKRQYKETAKELKNVYKETEESFKRAVNPERIAQLGREARLLAGRLQRLNMQRAQIEKDIGLVRGEIPAPTGGRRPSGARGPGQPTPSGDGGVIRQLAELFFRRGAIAGGGMLFANIGGSGGFGMAARAGGFMRFLGAAGLAAGVTLGLGATAYALTAPRRRIAGIG
jgi:hypothetical protein